MTDRTTVRHPDCSTPDDCRIRDFGGVRTLMAWTPIYDGNGEPLNADPNTLSESFDCQTCGRRWTRITRSGVVSYD